MNIDYIGIIIGIVLLLILERFLTYLPFDGYLGKLISLIILVLVANKNTFLGIIGVIIIIKNHTLNNESMTNNNNSCKAKFRKKNCENGNLVKNGKTISLDEIQSAFPNIEFSSNTCNPCNESCDFQIKYSKENITNEENLRPKDSKESFVYKKK